MGLAWTESALRERRSIRAYISRDDAAAARSLEQLLMRGAARLTERPEMGRPGRLTGTRELVVHRNYLLIYDVRGDLVRILKVLHTARQWPAEG